MTFLAGRADWRLGEHGAVGAVADVVLAPWFGLASIPAARASANGAARQLEFRLAWEVLGCGRHGDESRLMIEGQCRGAGELLAGEDADLGRRGHGVGRICASARFEEKLGQG